MRFGICYNIEYHEDIHGSPKNYYEMILQQTELIERLGYDTVWYSEHHCNAYSFGNPAVIAAAAAQRTDRIRIGTGVSLVPLHQPIFLAEQYGMLDVLSDGRLEYGIGRGYLYHEYDWLKIPLEESQGRYHEAMDFICKAWMSDGKPMDFAGEFYKADGYTYFPKPTQQPFPAVYASGAKTDESFRWAGEKGFHLGVPLFLPDLSNLPGQIGIYRQALHDHGHDPASREVMAITQMFCAEDNTVALTKGRRFAENYYRFFGNAIGTHDPASPIAAFYAQADALKLAEKDQVLLGDPETLIARIARLRDRFDIDFMLMEVAQGGATHEEACLALETFARHVMPHFQARQSAVVTTA